MSDYLNRSFIRDRTSGELIAVERKPKVVLKVEDKPVDWEGVCPLVYDNFDMLLTDIKNDIRKWLAEGNTITITMLDIVE